MIRLNPQHKYAYNNRGAAQRRLGKLEEAIADYKQAISLNPDYALAFNDLGAAYKLLGEYEQAVVNDTIAINLGPTSGLAFKNRGTAYAEQMNLKAALEDHKKHWHCLNRAVLPPQRIF